MTFQERQKLLVLPVMDGIRRVGRIGFRFFSA